MASYTANLHLIKPAYSDTRDIKDINDNMDTIDGKIGSIDQDIAGIKNKGSGNAGKFMKVANNGDVTPESVSYQPPVSASSPLTFSSNNMSLDNSGVTAGSYGPSANATPGYGQTFNVPYVTVDAKGRVTAASTKTVKIPASDTPSTYPWSSITNKPTFSGGTTNLQWNTEHTIANVGGNAVKVKLPPNPDTKRGLVCEYVTKTTDNIGIISVSKPGYVLVGAYGGNFYVARTATPSYGTSYGSYTYYLLMTDYSGAPQTNASTSLFLIWLAV